MGDTQSEQGQAKHERTLLHRGKRNNGTRCMLWGTSAPKVVMHFITFCPLKGILEGTLLCFVHWRATLDLDFFFIRSESSCSRCLHPFTRVQNEKLEAD